MKYIQLIAILCIALIANCSNNLKPKQKNKRNFVEKTKKAKTKSKTLKPSYEFDFYENLTGAYDNKYGTVTTSTADILTPQGNTINGWYFTSIKGLVPNSPLSKIMNTDSESKRQFISWSSFPKEFVHTNNVIEKDRYETTIYIDNKPIKVYFILKENVSTEDLAIYTNAINNARNRYISDLTNSKKNIRQFGNSYIDKSETLTKFTAPQSDKLKEIEKLNVEIPVLEAENIALTNKLPSLNSKIDALTNDLNIQTKLKDDTADSIKLKNDSQTTNKSLISDLEKSKTTLEATKKEVEQKINLAKTQYDIGINALKELTKFHQSNTFVLKADDEFKNNRVTTFVSTIEMI